ncbi:Uncharacterised protein [Mycobacterium tuberculosis]|uniref:Uncharacterized protein n=1 Tax=Mycobacterium tuberculosis TaxID=1773 RepID=A0A916LB62_MYCTX|nr:Uncharacterised protein [Mycobacterium tuberculosis]COX89378.1 Uncharacterised protein [Mycobacterium tuberculosis]COY24755.1 Uncharacterised protein [Mycobacterium tuberculosis]
MVRATIGWLLTNRIFTPRRRHRTDSWANTAYAHDPMKSRSRMSMTNGPGAMAIAALLLTRRCQATSLLASMSPPT